MAVAESVEGTDGTHPLYKLELSSSDQSSRSPRTEFSDETFFF